MGWAGLMVGGLGWRMPVSAGSVKPVSTSSLRACSRCRRRATRRSGCRLAEAGAGPVRAPIDRAVPLALVVSELVTNAVKYAFPDGREGTIRVSLRREEEQGGGTLAIAVRDDGVGLPESIADALEAPSIADVSDVQGRMFRAFADHTKSDRRALAACIRGSRQVITREQAASIKTPTLVAVCTKDPIAGSAEELAAVMPHATALPIPDRDHMLAVGDKVFKAGVLEFLAANA